MPTHGFGPAAYVEGIYVPINQSNQYNLATLLILAVLGLVMLGLGAILFFDDEEKPPVVEPTITEQITQTPEVMQKPQVISEPAPAPFTPNARLYAPQDYELEIVEPSDAQPPSQNGREKLNDIVDYETRPAATPRPIKEQDLSREPAQRFDSVRREDAAAIQQPQQAPRSVPAPHAPRYGVPRAVVPGRDWRAPEVKPQVSRPPTVAPSYGAPPTYPRYQSPGTVQGYPQPYTQPYYQAPPAPRRDTGPGAGYPAPDYRWRPPEQPPYPQPRGYTDRYQE